MQKILFALLISLALSAQLVFSQTVEETLQFAEEQFNLGNYTNSVLAYERAIYFEDNTSSETYFALANAYFNIKNIERAVRFYDNAIFLEKETSTRNEIIFRKCLALLSVKQFNQSIIALGSVNDFNDSEVKFKKQYFRSIAYFLKEDFDRSEKEFAKYISDLNLASNQHYIDYKLYNQKAAKIKPNLALWMSVFVPGSGQILYGNWKDGLNSLGLTAALVGLYFNYAIEFSLVEGYIVVLPWFQRYHKGGYLKAKETALKKQERYRAKAYAEILQLHPALF